MLFIIRSPITNNQISIDNDISVPYWNYRGALSVSICMKIPYSICNHFINLTYILYSSRALLSLCSVRRVIPSMWLVDARRESQLPWQLLVIDVTEGHTHTHTGSIDWLLEGSISLCRVLDRCIVTLCTYMVISDNGGCFNTSIIIVLFGPNDSCGLFWRKCKCHFMVSERVVYTKIGATCSTLLAIFQFLISSFSISEYCITVWLTHRWNIVGLSKIRARILKLYIRAQSLG